MDIIQRMESRFKDTDVEKYDFISHRPDGSVIDFKAIKVGFDMKTNNSVSSGFFEALREEGLEIHHALVLPSGLTPRIEFILYHEKEVLET